jgi:hypothetical protein
MYIMCASQLDHLDMERVRVGVRALLWLHCVHCKRVVHEDHM